MWIKLGNMIFLLFFLFIERQQDSASSSLYGQHISVFLGGVDDFVRPWFHLEIGEKENISFADLDYISRSQFVMMSVCSRRQQHRDVDFVTADIAGKIVNGKNCGEDRKSVV